MALEPLAGLARVSLTQDKLAQAQTCVEKIVSQLGSETLAGTDEPFGIYLTCYRVLKANQDPRGPELLKQAHQRLLDRAAKISDDSARHRYLENVAAHREIVKAWGGER